MISAFPLTWPPGFPRTAPAARVEGKFKTTLSAALGNVEDSIRRFAGDSRKKVEGLVISSNVTLGVQRPADPGIAVWFQWDGLQVCIPVDRYTKTEANLQAIHLIIEARRTELRHGGLAIVRATFTGFKALPAPGAGGRSWRDVLGFHPATSVSLDDAKHQFRIKSSAAHPDRPGGSEEKQAEINLAWGQAQAELGGNNGA